MINTENCPRVSNDYTAHELISYLESIKNAGTMNMYDSGPYLSERFSISINDAEKVVKFYLSQKRQFT